MRIRRGIGKVLGVVGIVAVLGVAAPAQETATGNSAQKETAGGGPARPAAASVIDQSQLVGLPMNGRSYTQLATLEGGVSDPSGGSRQGGIGSSITVSGGRGEWNSFLLDGTDTNDTDNRVPQSAAGGQLGADAVLQVQVFSTNYGAQYGRAAGGVLNAITRSGNNDWHGTLFEYLRNSKVDSRNFFDPAEKPPFKRNQFGAAVTGPVLPDKTFFMASLETLLNRLSETIVLNVPDDQIRLKAIPSVLPYAMLYMPGQFPILDKDGKPTGLAENRSPAIEPTNEYFFVGRVDHKLGDHDALFARYTFDDAMQTSVATQPRFPRVTESRQQYATLAETHFFSTALVNTTRLSYTRPTTQLRVQPTVEVPRSLYFIPDAPQMGNMNISGLTPLGPNPESPWGKVMNSYQAADDLIYGRRSHTWKLGMLLENFRWSVFDSQSKSAQWLFSSLDNFLNGRPGGTTLRVALPGSDSYRAFRETLTAVYLQDDYKLRSNLTLNLGLRYEFTTMIHDKRGQTVYLLDEQRDTEPHVGPIMETNPSLRNFAPRVGLSWAPGNGRRMVVRAGAGIYYDQIIEYSVDALRNTIPFYRLVSLPNADVFSGKTDPKAVFPNAVAVALAAGVKSSQLSIFEVHNPKTPTVYRYHFSLQQEIAPGITLEATYLGARGNHLLRNTEINQFPLAVRQPDGRLFFPPDPDPDPVSGPNNTVNPAFSSIQKVQTDAQSFYNSVVISVNQRAWKGLTLGGNYTYSKSVDDASSAGGSTGGGGGGASGYGLDRKLNRGLSSFDIRHRFSMRYFYTLPFGSGHSWLASGWAAHLLGGWRLGGVLTARTGQAGSVNYGIASDRFLFVSDRPDLKFGRGKSLTQGVTAGCNGVTAGRQLGGPDLYYDPCAFTPPAPGFIGNAARGIVGAPRVVNLDFSLQKDFAIDSRRSLQFRAEVFNLPNHSNFRGPEMGGTTVFRNAAGLVNPSAGRLRSTATTPRQIQFALRLSF